MRPKTESFDAEGFPRRSLGNSCFTWAAQVVCVCHRIHLRIVNMLNLSTISETARSPLRFYYETKNIVLPPMLILNPKKALKSSLTTPSFSTSVGFNTQGYTTKSWQRKGLNAKRLWAKKSLDKEKECKLRHVGDPRRVSSFIP